MKPLVSILVPVYNVEKYIECCATTLFEQTYENLEFVFVNDNTPDNSIAILEKVSKRFPALKKRIIIESHSVNKGLAASRKTGLNVCNGDYVTFVDSDDYLDKETIMDCMEQILDSGGEIAAFGFTHEHGTFNSIVLPHQEFTQREYLISALERKTHVNVCGKIYKKDLFTKYDVSFIEGINHGEDYVVGARLLYYCKKIVFVQKPFYHYVHYNTNSYTNVFRHSSMLQLLKAEQIIADFYTQKEDAELMAAHCVGRLKLKVEMITSYFLSKGKDIEDLSILLQLYPLESKNKEVIKKLSKQDMISMTLINWGNRQLLGTYIKMGFKIKSIIKKCGGCRL